MTRFDQDTALEPVGDGVFEGLVDPAWRIVRGANGGHLATFLLRGMTIVVGDSQRTPRTLTVHFTRVPEDRDVTVTVQTERSGRSMSTLSARMTQDDKLIAIGLGGFSSARTGPEFSDLAPPEVPGPDESSIVVDREDFPFGQHFDFRHALGGDMETRSDRAELGVWMRLRERRIADHLSVTQLLDAFAPAVFAKLGTGGGGAGVPTVEMTYHYRQQLPLPDARADDWYLGVFRTSTAAGGFIEEDGWLWTRTGTLVAQSRQLALLQTR